MWISREIWQKASRLNKPGGLCRSVKSLDRFGYDRGFFDDALYVLLTAADKGANTRADELNADTNQEKAHQFA